METKYSEIINKIELINPLDYSKNRNFIDGSVTKLSPYISRGLISTKYVFEKIQIRIKYKLLVIKYINSITN